MSIELHKKDSPIFPYIEPKQIIIRRSTGRILTKEIDTKVFPLKLKISKISNDKIKELESKNEESKIEIDKLNKSIEDYKIIIIDLTNSIDELEKNLDSDNLSQRIKHLEMMLNYYIIDCFRENDKIQLIACGERLKQKKCKKPCISLRNYFNNIGIDI